MRRDLVAIAGVTAVAATFVAATRTGSPDWLRCARRRSAGREHRDAGGPQTRRTPMPEASVGAQVARLTADLAAREADNANLRTVLAVRDAVLKSLKASLAEREATLDGRPRPRLAASEEEIASLRSRARRRSLDPDRPRSPARGAEVRRRAQRRPPRGGAGRDRRHRHVLRRRQGAGRRDAGLAALAPTTAGTEPPLVHVQFNFASASLTPGGQAHAAAAAVTLVEMALTRIRVVGHTDRVGSPAANRRLAARRARAVADFLVASGVPAALIEMDGMGRNRCPGQHRRRGRRAAEPQRRHHRRAGGDQLNRARVAIAPADPDLPEARSRVARYYAEIAQRFEGGFDPDRALQPSDDDLRPPRGVFLLATADGQSHGCVAVRLTGPRTPTSSASGLPRRAAASASPAASSPPPKPRPARSAPP